MKSKSRVDAPGPAFLTNSDRILQAAKDLIRVSASPRVAVAFWGKGAVTALALEHCPAGARVIVNAETGGSNPVELAVLRGVLDRCGAELKTMASLHAKVVIGDGTMLVGSANFSANGLGYQGRLASCWAEASVTVADAAAVLAAERWFDDMWSSNNCVPVTDAILALAKRRWRPRHKRPLPAPAGGDSTAMPRRDELEGVRCFVVVADRDASAAAEGVARREAKVRRVPSLPFYEDWRSIPRDALLIGFQADSEKRTSPETYDGAWISPAVPDELPVKGATSIQLVWPASTSELRDWRLVRPKILLTTVRALIDHLEEHPGAAKWLRRQPSDLVQYGCPTDWCLQLGVFLEALERFGIPAPVANTARKRPR